MIEVPLTRGRRALIDECDGNHVLAHRWIARPVEQIRGENWYAFRTARSPCGRKITLYLHRVVLNAGPGSLVDHIDGDGLNCRRANLRFATRALNNVNRGFYEPASGYRGVYWSRGRWSARISVGGHFKSLGSFGEPEEAARAYDRAAAATFGEFARLNFPARAAA